MPHDQRREEHAERASEKTAAGAFCAPMLLSLLGMRPAEVFMAPVSRLTLRARSRAPLHC
jgi:hypothetical protein